MRGTEIENEHSCLRLVGTFLFHFPKMKKSLEFSFFQSFALGFIANATTVIPPNFYVARWSSTDHFRR